MKKGEITAPSPEETGAGFELDRTSEEVAVDAKTQLTGQYIKLLESADTGRNGRDSTDVRNTDHWFEGRVFSPARELGIEEQEASAIFLNALIDTVQRKRNEGVGEERMHSFIDSVYINYFGFSPNISNYITFKDRFEFAARLTRVPDLQRLIGGAIIGEIVYDISGSGVNEQELNKIFERISQYDIATLLDIIEMLKTVNAQAIANGEWAYDAIKNVSLIVIKIRDSNPSQLVQYACESFFERTRQEMEQPSLSVIRFTEQVSDARLNEALDPEEENESELIESKVRPSISPPKGGRIARIANDALAIFDHSNSPVAYARIDPNELGRLQPKISFQTLEALEKASEGHDDRGVDLSTARRVFDFIEDEITIPVSNSSNPSPAEIATGLSKYVKCLDRGELERVFEAYDLLERTNYYLARAREEIRQYTEGLNEEISARAAEEFSKILEDPGLVEKLHIDDETRQRFEQYRQDNNLEGMYSIADWFILNSRYDWDSDTLITGRLTVDPDVARVRMYFEGVSEQHHKNWEGAEASFHQKNVFLERELSDTRSTFLELAQKAMGSRADFFGGLLDYAKKEGDVSPEQYYEVHFTRFEDIKNDDQINPFGTAEQDLPLLLSTLYKPHMRKKIEEDLGISLRDLNSDAQINLLRFLASSNSDQFTKLIAVLNKTGVNRELVANTFLSCSEDMAYGQNILTIIERFSPEQSTPILEKYNAIVSSARKVESLMTFSVPGRHITPVQASEVKRGMLKRANLVLASFVAETVDKQGTIEKLDSVREEILLFAETFKALSESGEDIKLEDFQSVSIEKITGPDIPESDKKQMDEIFRQNWDTPQTASIFRAIYPGFQEGLTRGDNDWYLVKYGDSVISFQRFYPLPDGSLYAASNNVAYHARGAKIGTACQGEVLNRVAQEGVVHAKAWARNRVFQHYIERSGFMADGIVPNFHESGEPFFSMVKDDRKRQALLEKGDSEERTFDITDANQFAQLDNLFKQGYLMVGCPHFEPESGIITARFAKELASQRQVA